MSNQITPETRDYARALLVSLGYDPSPNNVSKLYPFSAVAGAGISLETRNFLVFNSTEIFQLLEFVLLSNPFTLPSKYLALFISNSFMQNLDFSHVVQIAENFRKNPTQESLWTLRHLIEYDQFLNDHIREMLELEFGDFETGISKILDVFDLYTKRVCYKDQEFWVVELSGSLSPFEFFTELNSCRTQQEFPLGVC